MLFNSYLFILLFLPAVLCGYFLFHHFQKGHCAFLFLLGMSLLFYGYLNPWYLLVIGGSILLNYGVTRLLNHQKIGESGTMFRKILLGIGLVGNLSLLFYFKYFDFFIENMNQVLKTDFPLQHIILPLGISFFTFQQISYLVDAYRKETVQYTFLEYAVFVTFFPQLVAGPIVLHGELIPQFRDAKKWKPQAENVVRGWISFFCGLAKKVLLADTLGQAVNWAFQNPGELDTLTALFAVLAFTFQIYFDFSGYCDMAEGIARMFNFQLPRNFESPYQSLSVKEFWDRWHMTLTRFFTHYIYIPLGGNRKGTFCTYRNVFMVFLVSGFWHGAQWGFVLWGILHGVAVILTRLFMKQWNKLHPVLAWFLTFSFLNVTWIYFRAETISKGNQILRKILDFQFAPIHVSFLECFQTEEFVAISKILPLERLVGNVPVVLMLSFFCICFWVVFQKKNTGQYQREFQPSFRNAILFFGLTVWTILSLTGVSTFLYFNF